MPKQLATQATQSFPILDGCWQNDCQYGAQFALHDTRKMPKCIKLCEDDRKQDPDLSRQHTLSHHPAQGLSSSTNWNTSRNSRLKSASTSNARFSDLAHHIIARPWQFAHEASSEAKNSPKETGNHMPLILWQMENIQQQPWNAVAAVAAKGDNKVTSVSGTSGSSVVTEISICTIKRNPMKDRVQKYQE